MADGGATITADSTNGSLVDRRTSMGPTVLGANGSRAANDDYSGDSFFRAIIRRQFDEHVPAGYVATDYRRRYARFAVRRVGVLTTKP